MTYDLYAGADNLNNHHTGNSTEGIYRLVDTDGKEYLLNRKESLESSHFSQNQYPVTFRATYNSDRIQIRNLLAYTNLSIPTTNTPEYWSIYQKLLPDIHLTEKILTVPIPLLISEHISSHFLPGFRWISLLR